MHSRGLVLCTIVMAASGSVPAQSLVISDSDNDEKVELEVAGLVDLSASDSTITVRYSDGRNESYQVESIGKLDFTDATGVDMVSAMDGRIAYSGSTGLLIVANAEEKHLFIYNLGGSQVLERIISSQLETIDLSSLAKGVYLLKLDGKTIKIVR